MGFRKRKQQPHTAREESALQRRAKDSAKEAARNPVVPPIPETEKTERESNQAAE